MIPKPVYEEFPAVETPAWMEHLARQGFAHMPFLFAEPEILAVLQEFDGASFARSRAGVRHCLGTKAVRRIAEDNRLLEIVRQVLGPDALPFRATLFDKSPSANWLVVWHQDTALPLRQRRDKPGWGPWSVKAEWFMRTLQKRHCFASWRYEFIWMIPRLRMALCESCLVLTYWVS